MPSVLAETFQNQKGAELNSIPMKLGGFVEAPEKFSSDKVELGQLGDQLTHELNSTVALCMPVAVTGVTLIAHGAMASSDLCFFLGVACVVSIVVLHLWTRQKVRGQIVQLAMARGLSEKAAKVRANQYLSDWLG